MSDQVQERTAYDRAVEALDGVGEAGYAADPAEAGADKVALATLAVADELRAVRWELYSLSVNGMARRGGD